MAAKVKIISSNLSDVNAGDVGVITGETKEAYEVSFHKLFPSAHNPNPKHPETRTFYLLKHEVEKLIPETEDVTA